MSTRPLVVIATFALPTPLLLPRGGGFLAAQSRLNPKTGGILEYLMPTEFDAKKIAHDRTARNAAVLMANTRNARIVRVEPLD